MKFRIINCPKNNTDLLIEPQGIEISNLNKTMNEFIELKDNYNSSTSSDDFNLDTLDLFLKYNIISVQSADRLVEKGKIKTNNQERLIEILNKYRVNNNDNS